MPGTGKIGPNGAKWAYNGPKWVPFQEPLRNKVVPGKTNHIGGFQRPIIGRLTPNSCQNGPIDAGHGQNRAKWAKMGTHVAPMWHPCGPDCRFGTPVSTPCTWHPCGPGCRFGTPVSTICFDTLHVAPMWAHGSPVMGCALPYLVCIAGC